MLSDNDSLISLISNGGSWRWSPINRVDMEMDSGPIISEGYAFPASSTMAKSKHSPMLCNSSIERSRVVVHITEAVRIESFSTHVARFPCSCIFSFN